MITRIPWRPLSALLLYAWIVLLLTAVGGICWECPTPLRRWLGAGQ